MVFSPQDIRSRKLDHHFQNYISLEQQNSFGIEFKRTLCGVLIPQVEIAQRLGICAHTIARDFKEQRISSVVAVNVIKGGRPFYTALTNELYSIGVDIIEDAIEVSRYGGKLQGESTKVKAGPTQIKKGDSVLVIDDLVDEGGTLELILDELKAFEPSNVRVAVLLKKPNKFKGKPPIDYCLFDIDAHWVVGMGMDVCVKRGGELRSVYRHLPFVAVANPQYLWDSGQLTDPAVVSALQKLIHY